MPRRFTLLILILLLTACGRVGPGADSVSPASPTPEATPLPWWREAVFYEIFVRSYADSNGDGIGDFNGVTSKLDYLQELGITAIWLMPIHPSPSYHGYDVTDYYAANPEYGTLDDFRNLLEEAHRRDIRIIIDLVLNHTSSQHPFFVSAQEEDSEYRDWYIWQDAPPKWGSWHETANGFYYGFFCDCMPDLNYANPAVTEQMTKAATFWLTDVGVDGFRIDAAKHLFEADGKVENVPATHEWFAEFYRDYKAVNPEAYTVGEVYGAGGFIASTYRSQMDQVFNFELASGFVNSARGESNTGVNSAFTFTLKDAPDGDYATFLANHDQNRVMSVLNGDLGKAKVAATLLLTSPGTPFIYYGEEIGMQGRKPDEDIRLPMQWSGSPNAGFTDGQPWRAPDPGYAQINVAAQNEDPNSLLNHYRALIRLRMEYPALRSGKLTLLETGNPAVYAVLRHSTSGSILVIVNLKGTPIADYHLSLNENLLPNGIISPRRLFGTMDAMPVKISGGRFSEYKPLDELLPYESYLFQFE